MNYPSALAINLASWPASIVADRKELRKSSVMNRTQDSGEK
jgi:hypothetical protein